MKGRRGREEEWGESLRSLQPAAWRVADVDTQTTEIPYGLTLPMEIGGLPFPLAAGKDCCRNVQLADGWSSPLGGSDAAVCEIQTRRRDQGWFQLCQRNHVKEPYM